MKKRIKLKTYNTDFSSEIGKAHGGKGVTYYNEKLYLTNDGAFFLVGHGGMGTRWEGNETDQIIAISAETANEWMEINLLDGGLGGVKKNE